MKINIARSSGFCFGVRRAIDISHKLADTRKNVFVLGDIVHNSFVVDKLSKKGVRRIKRITPSSKKNSTLIISAHGAPKQVINRARAAGYRISDATCPRVRDIYNIAKKLEKNNPLIIIGDKGHTEVKGIAGQLKKKPIVIEAPHNIPVKKLQKIKKAAVITQSTQSIKNINAVMERLNKIIPDLELYNTTCHITRVKQEEIETLPENNDIVLIVGSSTSANTKRLYQIAKKINKRTYWIGSAEELNKRWFGGVGSVGIMAGASTPDEIVGAIVERLNSSELVSRG